MRIVCISDTHGFHDRISLPDGDVLVHAGDATRTGTFDEVMAYARWLRTVPHAHKVVIAGNHDFLFERRPNEARPLFVHAGIHYLEDSSVVIDGVHFYGSPWQPRFFDWAFNLDRGARISAVWKTVPSDVDVLITHGPPADAGPLDRTKEGALVGCADLRAELERIRPKLHVCGHIHEGYGAHEFPWGTCVNASTCTREYRPTNAPVVVDYDPVMRITTWP